MKILFAVIFIAMSLSSYAQCDYSVSIIETNSSFKILAKNLNGTATSIWAAANVTDFQGNLVKQYPIWEEEAVSRQKTSNHYSLKLNPGKYTINAEIKTACHDSNWKNNYAAKQVELIGEIPGSSAASSNLPYYNTIYLKKEEAKIYKSSSEKTKDIGLTIFLVASVILNIVLIWKR